MRDYTSIIPVIEDPTNFDAGNWASDRYVEALNDVFLPYAKNDRRQECLSRLHKMKIGFDAIPMLYLLALIKRDGYTYSPELVAELATGVPNFLDNTWKDGNRLARDMARLVGVLHNAGHSKIEPSDFVLLMTEAMDGHRMGRVALREFMIPMQWHEEAIEDPATQHLGQALLKSPALQEKLLTKIKDNRFIPALKHYPVEALAIAMDRPNRQDLRFGKELGL